jgi:hypothetical protein
MKDDVVMPKTVAPRSARPLLGPWIGYASAFSAFIVAGQSLASEKAALYDSMNIELPVIVEVQAAYPIALAASFMAWGLLLLVLTRVPVRSPLWLIPRVGLFLAAFLSIPVGVLLMWLNVRVLEAIQQSLGQ